MRVLIAVLSLSAFAACSTVNGIGQDIQKGGVLLQQTADDVREDLRRSTPQPIYQQPAPVYSVPAYPAPAPGAYEY